MVYQNDHDAAMILNAHLERDVAELIAENTELRQRNRVLQEISRALMTVELLEGAASPRDPLGTFRCVPPPFSEGRSLVIVGVAALSLIVGAIVSVAVFFAFW